MITGIIISLSACRPSSRTGQAQPGQYGVRAGDAAYLRDPAEIYRHSFATIRREVPVDGLPADIAAMAERVIHACGMTDILGELVFSPDIVQAGRAALAAGAPLLCDRAMAAPGIIVATFPPPPRFSSGP